MTSFSQKIKVMEVEAHIGGTKNPALVVNVFETSVEEVTNQWKSLMKDYKGKVSMQEELFADNVVISQINDNNTIDIYSKIEKVSDTETKLTVAFDLGGAFLSAAVNKEKLNEAKKLLSDFAVKTTKDGIASLRKVEERRLSNLLDEQRDLEKKQEKLASNTAEYKQKIVEYNQKIKEAEENTVKNKADIERKKVEVGNQTKAVEAITAKEKAVQ